MHSIKESLDESYGQAQRECMRIGVVLGRRLSCQFIWYS